MDWFKLLQGQILLLKEEKKAIDFDRDACNIKVGRLRALLSRDLTASS